MPKRPSPSLSLAADRQPDLPLPLPPRSLPDAVASILLPGDPAAALLSIAAARAALGGVGRSKLFELLRLGSLEARKLGRRTFITSESVARLLADLPKAEYRPPSAAGIGKSRAPVRPGEG